MLKSAGHFIFRPMLKEYHKSYKSTEELIKLLEQRGLSFPDQDRSYEYIKNIGYFRLSAYFYPLLQSPKSNHIYKLNSTFTNVLDMYRFDKKLRLLAFNEIEKIEVAIRSIMVNTACEYYGDIFWMTQEKYHHDQNFFFRTLKDIDNELSKSKEDFIIHFRNKYSDKYPPSWMIAEVLSLGSICRIFKNLSDIKLKKIIAKEFSLQPAIFESWIMALVGIRNICCHHGRLWNREFAIRILEPKKTPNRWLNDKVDIKRTYFRLCILKYFLNTISPNNNFSDKVCTLTKTYTSIDLNALGFQVDWADQPLWNK